MMFRSFFISLGFILILVPTSLYLKGKVLLDFIHHNFFMNSLILSVFTFGIIVYIWQALQLSKDITWLKEASKKTNFYGKNVSTFFLTLFQDDLRNMLSNGISPSKQETILKNVEKKVSQYRSLCRFTGGVLMFLGLLGTFWGLSQTVSSIATAIKSLSSHDMNSGFEAFKIALIAPLGGMGTAFSSSMFGLLGALLLSLLDIGLSKAYQGFLEDLYLLLKAYTKTAPEKTLGGAAYTQGVIEQLAENMYTLQQVLIASEEGKNLLIKSIQNMNERLLALSEEVKENHVMVKKFSHHTYELQQALKFISQQLSTTVLDETSKQSLRSIDTTLKQLLVESHETKNKMTQELRSEIRLVARTLSALANQDAAA